MSECGYVVDESSRKSIEYENINIEVETLFTLSYIIT